jgi:MFS family permease
MGIGMGMTMMPIMSAALAALTHHEVARGSTLMNIIQQSAGSVGTAVMSVILTNATIARPAAAAYAGTLQSGQTVDQIPDAIRIPGQSALAESFNSTFWVALVLIVLCLIPAAFLPRKRPEIAHEEEGPAAGTAIVAGSAVDDASSLDASDSVGDAGPVSPRH